MSDTFLPTNYEIPDSQGKYMRFEQGANKFRILGSFEDGKAIMGTEYWVTVDEKRKPKRLKPGIPVPVEELELNSFGEIDTPKHFWCLPVYNYQTKQIQILEITQKSIMRDIKSLAQNEDWGSPLDYDVTVTRTGEKLKTEYTVTPSPKKELDPKIYADYLAMEIKIEVLYDGDDPFKKEDINLDEIDVDMSAEKVT